MTRVTARVAGHVLVLVTALAVLGAEARPLLAQQPRANAAPRRLSQEQQLQRRLATLVREQLGLTDTQVLQLARVSEGYVRERRALVQREQIVRRGLRVEMERGAQADQGRVASAIEDMLELQRARIAVVEREQRELATFLTPVQRAKYLVLQQQVRRRLEEVRSEREAARPGRLAPPRLPAGPPPP